MSVAAPRLSPLRIDPSRTLSIREGLMREFIKRFKWVKRAVIDLVLTEDAFGLKPSKRSSFVGSAITRFDTSLDVTPLNERWKFRSNAEQVKLFEQWLQTQIDEEILQGTIDQYWEAYITQAYAKGLGRSFDETNKSRKLQSTADFYQGSKSQFLASSFQQPASLEKVKVLAGRVFTDLKGVTEDMAAKMKRSLVDGMITGSHPREIAREMANTIEGVSLNRAKTIARTEIMRAHAEGQLDAFEKLGVSQLGVMVEWSIAGDGRVCELCAPLDKIIIKLSEARNMIPRHPNAVFAGSTFVSYGECEEIVRAWYRGPAVVLTLRRGINGTTIGPNHPIMTRRGMIPAAELRKGDYVLYDNRFNQFPVGRDIDKIPMVSDVFGSLLEKSPITSTSSDLHGDRVFCQGKIEAIRPASGLLTIWDSFGIEELRKIDFAGTDSELEFSPSFSAGQPSFQRVLLTSSSRVGESGFLGGGISSEFDSHSLQPSFNGLSVDFESVGERTNTLPVQVTVPNFFQWEMIHNVSFTTYEGLAFDATTNSTVYNSDGLVVSNCRCVWIPSIQKTAGKKDTKEQIDKAIDESVRREIPKKEKGKRSLRDQSAISPWGGARKKIDKERAKSVLDDIRAKRGEGKRVGGKTPKTVDKPMNAQEAKTGKRVKVNGVQRDVYRVDGINYVKDTLPGDKDTVVIIADVEKLDKEWARSNPDLYVPKGGGGAEIGGRRAEFEKFIEEDPNRPIEMPRVGVLPSKSRYNPEAKPLVGFANGRHRFSIIRDKYGKETIAIQVDKATVEEAKRLLSPDYILEQAKKSKPKAVPKPKSSATSPKSTSKAPSKPSKTPSAPKTTPTPSTSGKAPKLSSSAKPAVSVKETAKESLSRKSPKQVREAYIGKPVTELKKDIREHIAANSKPLPGYINPYTTNPEDMVSVEIGGIEWIINPSITDNAIDQIAAVIVKGGDAPERLMRATKKVVMTVQSNKGDAYYAKLYNRPGATASANAGRGTTTIYHGTDIPHDTFNHESGHNLASELWGDFVPPPASAYGQAQAVEGPVSKYGAVHPQEDFAEACKLYAAKKEGLHTLPSGEKVVGTGHELLKTRFPKKYEAMKDLLGE